MNKNEKIEIHKTFWKKKYPSLIFIPPAIVPLYELDNYKFRFFNPEAMWKNEMDRAKRIMNWPTDGIPTVRSNLGVIILPAIAGQSFQIAENSMPWPGTPLSRDQIRSIYEISIENTEIFGLLKKFYEFHLQSNEKETVPYVPDTQGLFDVAHLLYGDEIFLDLIDESQREWIDEIFGVANHLYVSVTEKIKEMIGEAPTEMIHGHGTEQGLYFPNAGIRISEDTATLLSPETIDQIIIPSIKNCIVEPNEGVFLHYCGSHPTFFDQLTAMHEVKAIDLGNPEMYDLSYLLRRCAETDTVLYSRIAVNNNEDWRTYTQRVGREVAESGARVVFRPLIFPNTKEECLEMQEMFHSMTDTFH